MDSPREQPKPPRPEAVRLRTPAEQRLAFVRYLEGAESEEVEREILQLRGEALVGSRAMKKPG